MLTSLVSVWLRQAWSQKQVAVIAVAAVALVVGCAVAVQGGLVGIEAGGEVGLEMGNVSSSGASDGTTKTGP